MQSLFPGPGLAPDGVVTGLEWPAPLARAGERQLRTAAVLVPLIDHPDGMTVLLTQRRSDLPDHAGQIAFPGGQREPGDATPEDTALRETHEEVGIPPEEISLLGRLSPRDTGTGFRVMPVVGLVRGPVNPVAQASEVAHIFEVPLSAVSNSRNFRKEARESQGEIREFWVMDHDEFYIWGLTARILREMSEFLERS